MEKSTAQYFIDDTPKLVIDFYNWIDQADGVLDQKLLERLYEAMQKLKTEASIGVVFVSFAALSLVAQDLRQEESAKEFADAIDSLIELEKDYFQELDEALDERIREMEKAEHAKIAAVMGTDAKLQSKAPTVAQTHGKKVEGTLSVKDLLKNRGPLR